METMRRRYGGERAAADGHVGEGKGIACVVELRRGRAGGVIDLEGGGRFVGRLGDVDVR